VIRRALGRVAYVPTWRAMQAFTASRDAQAPDQLWLVEHPPVFTLGLAGRPAHVLAPGAIPVVTTDRGGQVTYHGPGQAVVYVLMDLRRGGYGVREMVRRIESAVLEVLEDRGVRAGRREGMPGVYVDQAKIAAIGLRVSRGCTYHGVSLNVDGDLEPFSRIDPCGYPGLEATRLADHGVGDNVEVAGRALAQALERHLAAHG
jgi:lipoyl(octanoyl) transferase